MGTGDDNTKYSIIALYAVMVSKNAPDWFPVLDNTKSAGGCCAMCDCGAEGRRRKDTA